jgi:3-dehydroquinate synthase
MPLLEYTFSGKKVQYYLDTPFSRLGEIVPASSVILITDEVVYSLHAEKFAGHKRIVIPAGEQYKNQSTVDDIIRQLIELKADRKTFIVAVGGGVVTDIGAYAACIYMRGLRFGLVPTTILAQVDASIGGKNGIDVGMYKNIVGIIRQPEFILFDHSLLQTLPKEQWQNGFAEIIKHACIKDDSLFRLLEQHQLEDFQQDGVLLAALIKRNVAIKSEVVERDEFEQGERKLLNFGHTVGHAIENMYELMHGFAISIGMVIAASMSVGYTGLGADEPERIAKLLQRYHLPVSFDFNKEKVFRMLVMDKKRVSNEMSFILLNRIGEGTVQPIPLDRLEEMITNNLSHLQKV